MSKAKRIRPNRKKQAFLDALAQGATMSGAANAAGVARTTAYGWRNEDQNFASAWDEAFRLGASALEDEAYRRAVTGVRRPVGRTVAFSLDPFETTAHTVEYSDRLLITLLKARDPERFCERARLAALKRKWAKEDANAPESYEVNPAILEALDRIEAEKAAGAVHEYRPDSIDGN